jgi:hypothetical protein
MKKLIAIGVIFMLFGCGSVDVNKYAGKKPEITLKDFYSGPVHGYGIFQNRSGEVTDRYYAYLIPTWKGNEGTIHEKQWRDDGSLLLEQVWNVKLNPDGKSFTATGTKIVGQVKGKSDGFALNMKYSMLVPRGDSGQEIEVNADDWTYLQPDGTGLNKISLSKFGFHIGDVIYNLKKLAPGEKLNEGYLPN